MDEQQLKEKLRVLLEPDFYLYPEVTGWTRSGQRVRADFIIMPKDRTIAAGLIDEPIVVEVKATNKKDCFGVPFKAFAQCTDYLWGIFPINRAAYIPYTGFIYTGYTQDAEVNDRFFNGVIRMNHQFRVGFIKSESRFYRYEFYMGDTRWFYRKESGELYASQAGQVGKFKAGNRGRHREDAA